jgi:hypothetical protein
VVLWYNLPIKDKSSPLRLVVTQLSKTNKQRPITVIT